MKKVSASLSALLLAGVLTQAQAAPALQLTSPDVREGHPLAAAQVFNGMGCTGGNQSPALNWTNLPAGTKSLAVTAYDPDAPTGSGWWHWVVVNL
ncbi:MAG: YbhB/YbcL family Raf kinase inhibitor-like protein, partial [Laribacter sp.]|nr:YbhB/YbcL family Raf kinase inhibitor-like protein [Laribacter sp.]